ncbi:hypothetical protein [Microbispora bryophytorum]|uniref:hypothetical protein n=1 Tax=Microbispora bryophytorum TaxID=1460882 RepID=UPI00371337A0
MPQDEANRLGEYLHARRDLVTPQQAGIPGGVNRRVPGLRREEVAMLADISAWRGIATRYDKTPESYLAGLHLRASLRALSRSPRAGR